MWGLLLVEAFCIIGGLLLSQTKGAYILGVYKQRSLFSQFYSISTALGQTSIRFNLIWSNLIYLRPELIKIMEN